MFKLALILTAFIANPGIEGKSKNQLADPNHDRSGRQKVIPSTRLESKADGHEAHSLKRPNMDLWNSKVWTIENEAPEKDSAEKPPVKPVYQTIDEAIAKGDINDVKTHLSLNPESANKGGKETSRPPLEQAIMRKKAEIATLLLESGANPNTSDTSKRTPLHLAVERNSPDMAKALLKAGAKPNAQDKDGWTPLHHAAAKNQLETSKAILAGGADPMTLSNLGGTALHEAAASGGEEVIRLFLAHKVDPSVKSKQGVTALDIAKEYKNQAAIDVLSKL